MSAFDVHVHIPDKGVEDALGKPVLEASIKYFRADYTEQTFEEAESSLASQGVRKYALLPVPSKLGDADKVNALTAQRASTSSMAVGFAWVNPLSNPLGSLRKAAKMGLNCLKVHPTLQEIRPDHQKMIPVYTELSQVAGIVVVHTGTSGIGGGIRGGGGYKIDYSRPVYVDSVAADFPDVTFIMAHFGWPWVTEAIAISLQKENVYLDLSGWSPKYVSEEVWRYARSLLKDRVVYGSDYPFIQPSRWFKEFHAVGLPEDVERRILWENAARLFKGRIDS